MVIVEHGEETERKENETEIEKEEIGGFIITTYKDKDTGQIREVISTAPWVKRMYMYKKIEGGRVSWVIEAEEPERDEEGESLD